MTHQLDDEAVLAARALVEALEARAKGPVKVRDAREGHRCNVHAAYVAGIDALLTDGWSLARVAGHLGVERATLHEWYHYGDQKRCQWPGWVFAGLPVRARTAFMRASLGWSETAPVSKLEAVNG